MVVASVMAMAVKLALTDRAMTLDTDAMKEHQSHRRYFYCFCFYFSAMISALRLTPLPDWRERSNLGFCLIYKLCITNYFFMFLLLERVNVCIDMFGCRKEDGESLISTRFLAMPERSTKCYPFKKYFFCFFPILNESNLPLGLRRFPIGGNAQMFLFSMPPRSPRPLTTFFP